MIDEGGEIDNEKVEQTKIDDLPRSLIWWWV